MSPTNLSMVPRCAKTTSTIRVKYWFSCRTRSSASPLSESVVKPRMSEKSTVISRRWPPSTASVGLARSC